MRIVVPADPIALHVTIVQRLRAARRLPAAFSLATTSHLSAASLAAATLAAVALAATLAVAALAPAAVTTPTVAAAVARRSAWRPARLRPCRWRPLRAMRLSDRHVPSALLAAAGDAGGDRRVGEQLRRAARCRRVHDIKHTARTHSSARGSHSIT